MEGKCDVVIVGAGIAGLSFALYLTEQQPNSDIVLISKEKLPESNTWLAQGGIAAVTNLRWDSFEKHINDTLEAGQGLSDPEVVKGVVYEAPERIIDLIRWGVSFDRRGKDFDLHREGGHSAFRILHHKDFTGREIHQKLLQRVRSLSNIHIMSEYFVTDLLIQNGRCTGVNYLDANNNSHHLQSRTVMLATGGSGQLFEFTTNSRCATGDGVAMAARAGVAISDLQHYQFHPTALFHPKLKKTCLISEAVRGHGAHLINKAGRRFVFEYDQRGELATRDVVADAIFKELAQSGEKHVLLKTSHLDAEDFKCHFPTIYEQCTNVGIDVSKDDIPILPAAHYQCGGIIVDHTGQTSIPGLYAGGECACTGLHGANRLASNSLLEALVYAYRSAQALESDWPPLYPGVSNRKIPAIENYGSLESIDELRKELQRLMSRTYHARTDHQALTECQSQIALWKRKAADSPTTNRMQGEWKNLLEAGDKMVNAMLCALGSASAENTQYYG